jgi:hypothetical protein
LELCSDAAIERQLWALSHPLDVAAPIDEFPTSRKPDQSPKVFERTPL